MAKIVLTERTLRDLGWPQILEALASRTQTVRGAEQARALPLLEQPAEIEGSWARLEEARQLIRRQLPMPLGGVEDIRPSIERARKGAVLQASEIIQCAQVARTSSQVRSFVSGLATDVPLLASVVQGLADLRPLASQIDATFEPSGLIRDDASVDLAGYRARSRSLHKNLKGRIEGLLNEPTFGHYLQDSYYSVRNDRYVVPIKANFRGQVPGIVHNASQSGQTIFVELQELVPQGNDLAIAESLAAEEELRVLAEFSEQIADQGDVLLRNATLLEDLDVIQASGRLADELHCGVPKLGGPESGFHLMGARHPLLVLQGKRVVANTVTLRQDQGALVVSGPNAGGKTVAMTTVGLCLLMARAGLAIPAEDDSLVPLVDGLWCNVGDAQDLSRDLSTFTAHVEGLAEALRFGREGWLCLIDEIAAGTDPTEGSALAIACLEALIQSKAQVIVTTHLEEVKACGVNDPRYVNARVGHDPESFRPTFRLELGVAGVSKAIDVAAQAGLPASVIESARENLGGSGALTVALEKLENTQRQTQSERDELVMQRRAVEEQRREVENKLVELEKKRLEVEQAVRAELAQELEQVREKAASVVAKLQVRPTMQAAQQAEKDLRSLKADQARRQAVLDATLQHGAASVGRATAAIAPGTRVRIVPLARDGEVLAVEQREALVRVGSLKTRVGLEDLVTIGAPSQSRPTGQEKKQEKRGYRDTQPTREQEPEATCDIRGLRADEAASRVEAFLDEAFLHGPRRVRIVHGVGTGVLRQIVRKISAASPYVRGHRAGDRHEGGDGVTILDLNPS